MTLPDERYRAVIWAERFLREIATDTKKYPRVPKAVRREAYSILRHYPTDYDMERCVEGAAVFAKQLDPLYKMVKRHEMAQSIEEELTLERKEGTL